jgi:hypothetical protein
MVSVGRRSTGNSSYNPLADGALNDPQTALTWHCIAESDVPYYSQPDFAALTSKFVATGSKVIGKKEGEWIKETDSKLYVPYKSQDTKERLFKNERLIIYEQRKAAGENPGLIRFSSSSSIGSIDWDYSAPIRMTSAKSQASIKSSGTLKSSGSQDHGDKQSVWICSSSGPVPYYCEAGFDAETSGLCEPGEKVTAVKQGNWLMVVEVKESVDVVGAIGRRSSRGIIRQTSTTDGRYLPFLSGGGERLFKNEKVEAWEKIKAGVPPEPKKDNCVLM